MKKVLVTGFDPFGGEAINPGYEAVKLIPNKIAGADIVKVEIPTVFHESINALADAMHKHKPDIVICIGQAGGRFPFTPERVAINVDDARIPDNKENQPIDVPIFKDGAPAYFTRMPVKALVKAVKEAGIPAAVSNTAGTFVCNHLMYGLLYKIATVKEFKNIRGGFIHVPFATSQVVDKPDKPSLSIPDMAKAIEISVKVCIECKNDISAIGGEIA